METKVVNLDGLVQLAIRPFVTENPAWRPASWQYWPRLAREYWKLNMIAKWSECLRLWGQYRQSRNSDELLGEICTNPSLNQEGPPFVGEIAMLFFLQALIEYDWGLAERLLTSGINLIPGDEDWGPLHEFIEIGSDRPDVVAWLLNRGAERDRRGRENYTPLHLAASLGLAETMRILLDRGTDVDCGTEIDGDLTPLMLAASNGQMGCVRILLERGADPHRKDKMLGITAREFAQSSGESELAEFLARYR